LPLASTGQPVDHVTPDRTETGDGHEPLTGTGDANVEIRD